MSVHELCIMNGILVLQWLKDDFLGYLSEWEKSVSSRDGFTSKEKSFMCLSRETLEGLQITG